MRKQKWDSSLASVKGHLPDPEVTMIDFATRRELFVHFAEFERCRVSSPGLAGLVQLVGAPSEPNAEDGVETLVYTAMTDDANTGIVYAPTRAYVNTVGAWLEHEPIGFVADDANLYPYVS